MERQLMPVQCMQMTFKFLFLNFHACKYFYYFIIFCCCMNLLFLVYAWLYVSYTIVDFKSSLELVLYVWFISTLNKALNWIELNCLCSGEGYDSVPFNVMEQIKIFVPWIFQLSFPSCICGHNLLFHTISK